MANEKIKFKPEVLSQRGVIELQAAIKEALEYGFIEIVDYVDGQPAFKLTEKGKAAAIAAGPRRHDPERSKRLRPGSR
jgi:hypothetical protein